MIVLCGCIMACEGSLPPHIINTVLAALVPSPSIHPPTHHSTHPPNSTRRTQAHASTLPTDTPAARARCEFCSQGMRARRCCTRAQPPSDGCLSFHQPQGLCARAGGCQLVSVITERVRRAVQLDAATHTTNNTPSRGEGCCLQAHSGTHLSAPRSWCRQCPASCRWPARSHGGRP